jgi:hypothetical protein
LIKRYGKASGPLLALKQDFFVNNKSYLRKSIGINKVYAAQEERKCCKNCEYLLSNKIGFTKQGVRYTLCDQCGHLNGANEDTNEFCSALYTDDGGESYAKNYTSGDKNSYKQRVNDIYAPKAKFLLDSLREVGESICDLKVVDLGAGSGYFVNALTQLGVNKPRGFEVSDVQVALGNMMMDDELLTVCPLQKTTEIAKTVNADVVTMIGVLEHLQKPRDILYALRNNKSVKYLYISVPLFSPTVFFEMVFPEVMQRQLSEGYTHLYTESSLNWMADEFSMNKIAAWWFGTDMVDLYRDILVQLNEKPETSDMTTIWNNFFTPVIDAMQLEMDKKHLSSEVHILFKFES